MHAVDGLLHALMVALAVDLDPFAQIAAADQPEHAIAFADRQQDGVEHLVDALDHLGVGALERRGVAALVQLSLAAEFRQFRQLGLELLQHQGDAVDVLLHPFVVALVGLGDELVDPAVGDLVEDAIALADRQQDGVQHFVDALDHLAVGALERRRVAALLQLPLPAEFRQLGQLGFELLQHQGDAVDVLLHPFVVALVGLGDQLVDAAVSDLVEDAIALADRQQDGVQHFVDALDHVAISALECRGVAALLQLSLPAEFRQLRQLGFELLQHQGDAVDVLLHPFVVALVGLGDELVDRP